jgi:hypothetical protein
VRSRGGGAAPQDDGAGGRMGASRNDRPDVDEQLERLAALDELARRGRGGEQLPVPAGPLERAALRALDELVGSLAPTGPAALQAALRRLAPGWAGTIAELRVAALAEVEGTDAGGPGARGDVEG